MSVHVSSLVWKATLSKSSAKVVLLKLADHAKDDGSDAYPALRSVVDETGCCERTVQGVIRWAVAEGVLHEEPSPGNRPNRYRFDLQRLANLATPQNLHPAESAPSRAQNLRPSPQNLRPINKNHPLTVIQPSFLEGAWERFFAAYPKRDGSLEKAKGRAKFEALAKEGTDLEAVIAGTVAYARHCDLTKKTGTAFVKQIPTFLNGRGWEEDYRVNQGSARRSIDDVQVAG